MQSTNLQQLHDAIMSICQYEVSEECVLHIIESMRQRIKAVLKAKDVQPSTSKVCLIKRPLNVHSYRYIRYIQGRLNQEHLDLFEDIRRYNLYVIFILSKSIKV